MTEDKNEDLRIQVLMGSIEEKKLVEKIAEEEHRNVSNFCRVAILDRISKFKSADKIRG